jgi:hypothetical protein
MTTLLKPSTLIPKGLQVQQMNHLTLFKFTDDLGERLQTLLDRKKADTLTCELEFGLNRKEAVAAKQ